MATGVVTFVESYPEVWAGSHKMTAIVANGLLDAGWRVRILLPGPGPVADGFRAAGMHVDVVAAPPELMHYGRDWMQDRRAVVAASAALPVMWARVGSRLRGSDVVHLNDDRSLLLAGPPARALRLPIVWQLHAISLVPKVMRLGRRLATEVVTVSSSSLQAMPPLQGRAMVEEHPITDDLRGLRPNVATRPPVLACVARLHALKRIDLLLAAAVILRQRQPDLRVRVVGGKPDGSDAHGRELLGQLADLHLESHVDFVEWTDDPMGACAGASVYVQPSDTETFGLAVVEAMARALPVVVTDVPGLCERVTHEQTGLVVPPSDAGALAAAIDRLLESPELARCLGTAAYAHVQRGRTQSDYVASWLERYLRLARRDRAS